MSRFSDIAVFIFFNTLGFFSAVICYAIGLISGKISTQNPDFTAAYLEHFFMGIILTWLVCAIFSLSSFFLKGTARLVFLLAPVVIPMGYGLRVLFLP